MSASEPRWEWVEGDSAKAATFRLATGLLIGASSATVLVAGLNALGGWGVIAFSMIPVSWFLLLISSVLAVQVAYSYYFSPSRFPLIRRMGISPVGLRLGGMWNYYRTVAWSDVVQIGPGRVWLRPRFGAAQAFRLTDRQTERLTRFVYPG